jgi:hypothetical protein
MATQTPSAIISPEQAASAFGLGDTSADVIAAADQVIDAALSRIEPAPSLDDAPAAPDAPALEPSADTSPEHPDEPADVSPEEEAKAGKVRGGHQILKQARSYKERGKKALAEAQAQHHETVALLQQLEHEKQTLAPARAIAQAMQSGNIDEVIARAAATAGISPDTVMRRWVERQAKGDTSPEQAEPETEALRELRSLKEERQREKQQQAVAFHQTQVRKYLGEAQTAVLGVKSDPSLKARYPHLAALPERIIRESVANMTFDLINRGRAADVDLDVVAVQLDNYAKELKDSFAGESVAVPSAPTGGQGSPAQSAKPERATPPATFSGENVAAANSVKRLREMTEKERIELADRRAQQGALALLEQESGIRGSSFDPGDFSSEKHGNF